MPVDAGIRTTFSWIAIGVVGLNLLITVVDLLGNPHAYRPGFGAVVLGLLAALLGLAVAGMVRGRGGVPALRGVVVVAVLALAAHPWAWLVREEYPSLLRVLAAAMAVSAIVSVPWSLPVIAFFTAGTALLRAPEVGWWQAGTESALLGLGGLVGTACVAVFVRAGRTVNEAVAQSWRDAEERERLIHRRLAREQWDGLVHDTVLGALSLAARAPDHRVPPAARSLAQDALATLRGEGLESSPAVQRWRDHAQRLGLAARFRVHGALDDPQVRDAIAGAVNEALSNVERHSGQRQVSVSGVLARDSARIVVQDRGRGFDPARTAHGIGLRTSVAGRVRAVGGDVTVTSAPGRGTRVVVSWQRRDHGLRLVGTEWELSSFAPMVVLALAVLAVVSVASYPVWSATPWPGIAVILLATVLLHTVASIVARPTPRTGAVLAVAAALIALVGVWNTTPGAPPDWRYWYVSALTPAIAVVSYRFRGRTAAAAVLGVAGVVVVVDTLAGRPPLGSLTQGFPVLVAMAVAARLIRRALADSWETVEEVTRRGAELRLALAAESVLEREAEARIADLEATVGADLVRLATEGVLDPGDRTRFALVGGAVRDQLAAPGLLDNDMVAELRRARARGVDVDIVAEQVADGGGEQPCEACRQVLRALLRSAPQGVRIRATWVPNDVGASLVTAVGDGLAEVAAEVERVARELGRAPVVDLDEDTLLVGLAGLADGDRPTG